jgi:hypothetical protein
MNHPSQDTVASAVYICVLGGSLYALFQYNRSLRRHIQCLETQMTQLKGNDEQINNKLRTLEDTMRQYEASMNSQAAVVGSNGRSGEHGTHPYISLAPTVQVPPNNMIKWDAIIKSNSDVFQRSNDDMDVTVMEAGAYMVMVRCLYAKPPDVHKFLTLLVNGSVSVQYRAPEHGAFGPTELLLLDKGDVLNVEYYAGKDDLECAIDPSKILLTLVQL